MTMLFENRSKEEQAEIAKLFSVANEEEAVKHVASLQEKGLLDTYFSELDDSGDGPEGPEEASLLQACLYDMWWLKRRYFIDHTANEHAASALIKAGEPLKLIKNRYYDNRRPPQQDIANTVKVSLSARKMPALLAAIEVAEGVENISINQWEKESFLKYVGDSWEFLSHNGESPELAFKILRALKIPLDNDVLRTFLQARFVEGAEEALKQGARGHSGNPLVINPYNIRCQSDGNAHKDNRTTALAAIHYAPMMEMLANHNIRTDQVIQDENGNAYNIWDTLFSHQGSTGQINVTFGKPEFDAMRLLVEQYKTPLVLQGGMDPLRAAILSSNPDTASKALNYLLPKYTKEMITPELMRTVIMHSSNDKVSEVLDRFIELGVDLSPYLPEAAKVGSGILISRILKQNPSINVDVRDSKGNTALMWACASENFELALGLLGLGADPCLTNQEGKSPGILFHEKLGDLAVASQ